MFCDAKGMKPEPGLNESALGEMAVLDFLAGGKGFSDLNDRQRRCVAALEGTPGTWG